MYDAVFRWFFCTTSDRSVGMMVVDEALLMLPFKNILYFQFQVIGNDCWRFHSVYLPIVIKTPTFSAARSPS